MSIPTIILSAGHVTDLLGGRRVRLRATTGAEVCMVPDGAVRPELDDRVAVMWVQPQVLDRIRTEPAGSIDWFAFDLQWGAAR